MKKLKLLKLVALTVITSNFLMPMSTQAAEFNGIPTSRMVHVDTQEANASRLLPEQKLIDEKTITPNNVVVDVFYNSGDIRIEDDGIYRDGDMDFRNPVFEVLWGFKGYLSSKDGKIYPTFKSLPNDVKVAEGRPVFSIVLDCNSPYVKGVRTTNKSYWKLLGTTTIAAGTDNSVARRGSISQAVTTGLTETEAYTLARTVGYSMNMGANITIPQSPITGTFSYGISESIQESFQKSVATTNQETTTITQFYDPTNDGKEHLVGLYQRIEEFKSYHTDQAALDQMLRYIGGGIHLSVNRNTVVKLNVTDSADVVLQ